MASANLAVAKASLSATLFRPDPKPCSRDDIDHFFSLLTTTVTQCSPANVQKCKQWALHNLVQSSGRVVPFGKYLSALTNSFTSDASKTKPTAGATPSSKSPQPREPSDKRKRLHLLYILNDIFYHTKFRSPDDSFSSKFEPFLVPLIQAAANFSNCPKHVKKIHHLITIWEEKGYFAADSISKLHAAVDQAPSSDLTKNSSEESTQRLSSSKPVKEAPFVMPAMHGDPSTPWYDLPAGNWLPVLEPNSTRPMNPSQVKPLQLASGPADKTLVDAVKKLLVDVDNIYAKGVPADDAAFDIDQLGEQVELDEITGEILGGETYYGWSRTFCEKMKERRNKQSGPTSRALSRRGRSSRSPSRSSRSPSYDRSRSSSRGPTKRRRLSRSPHEWGGRNRRRSRSRYRESSSGSYRRRSWSRSRSASRSRSRDRSNGRQLSDRRGSPEGYSPPPPAAPDNAQGNSGAHPQPYNNHQAPPFGFNPGSFPPIPPMGSVPPMPPYPGFSPFGAFQAPPPPPPNYQGQWPPPPPPPPPPQAMGGNPQNFFQHPNAPPPHFQGGWQPAPPFPPHGYSEQQGPNQFQYGGRGGGSMRGRGRGGYGRGAW